MPHKNRIEYTVSENKLNLPFNLSAYMLQKKLAFAKIKIWSKYI